MLLGDFFIYFYHSSGAFIDDLLSMIRSFVFCSLQHISAEALLVNILGKLAFNSVGSSEMIPSRQNNGCLSFASFVLGPSGETDFHNPSSVPLILRVVL